MIEVHSIFRQFTPRQVAWITITAAILFVAALQSILLRREIPETWEERTRRESIRILGDIASTNDLQRSVGNAGAVLTLTNGSWIVIRVVLQFEPEREVAIARDSEGRWFEGQQKLTGALTWYRAYKAAKRAPPGQTIVTVPECAVLDKMESSSNLVEAEAAFRRALRFLSFSGPTKR